MYGEIRKSVYFYLRGEYNVIKDFNDFFTNSVFKDISQINISYFTVIFTPFLVKACGFRIVYFVSTIIIFISMISVSNIKFLSEEDLNERISYNNFQFSGILSAYLSIYTFGGIISFIPIILIEKLKNEKEYLLKFTILCFVLTLSVILKNMIHFYKNSLPFESFIIMFFIIL